MEQLSGGQRLSVCRARWVCGCGQGSRLRLTGSLKALALSSCLGLRKEVTSVFRLCVCSKLVVLAREQGGGNSCWRAEGLSGGCAAVHPGSGGAALEPCFETDTRRQEGKPEDR